MDDLQEWMRVNRFAEFHSAFVDVLGVECVEDLELVTEGDLPLVGLKPIQARRFLRLSCAGGNDGRAVLPTAAMPPPAREAASERRGVAGSAGGTLAVDGHGSLMADKAGSSGVVGPSGTTPHTPVRQSALPIVPQLDGSATSDEEGDTAGGQPLVKRRKFNRLSGGQLIDLLDREARGARRMSVPEPYENGLAKAPSEAASFRGTGRRPIGAGSCRCLQVLESFSPQFDAAKRTARELQLASRGTTSGGKQNARSLYNYARLGSVVIDVLFDGRGNWMVHEACARGFLNVSNWWLARCHNRSIAMAHTPTVKMTKSSIASSSNVDSLVDRIRRPDDCLLSARQYFKASSLSTVFEVTSSDEHRLVGAPSNRAKVAERKLFQAFVRANRSPTGRTADKNGRYHGATFYLDSKWVVLRNGRTNDSRPSFSASFIAALEAAGYPAVHSDIPLRWLRDYFGSTMRLHGSYVSSDQHTTLYPHKTDACSTCEFFSSDIRTAKQSLKRHLQQPDQASMQRQDAIQEVKTTIAHLEDAARRHKDEASCAIQYHKNVIEGAAKKYEELASLFNKSLSNAPMEDTDAEQVAATESIITQASKGWFEVSSDYQQDKAVPSWNQSPQPGPTYFMSGETHYVHIFCAESCGETTGQTRYSRNLVYTRSERVGGSKSSDDTLSTLSDMLLGGLSIGSADPPIFRSGFGVDGLLGADDA